MNCAKEVGIPRISYFAHVPVLGIGLLSGAGYRRALMVCRSWGEDRCICTGGRRLTHSFSDVALLRDLKLGGGMKGGSQKAPSE